MRVHSRRNHRIGAVGLGAVVGAILVLALAESSQAATVIDGPINLGTAATYGVLGASTVTNTGPTVVTGDLGVSPGTSITGISAPPNGSVIGTIHQTDAPAALAENDLTTAYNVAASLTPKAVGLHDLAGASLVPGVYRGGALSLTGTLTLAGDASSIWVFQAASTLIIASNTHILLTGGASGCNVFWQVGSSATIGTGAAFVGTVMAAQSITATTGATVQGRLLARTGAVTLDDNVISAPAACADASTTQVLTTPSPELTSAAPPSATVGVPYSFQLTASGTPAPTFAVSSGSLAPGLQLDSVTGIISGTPTSAGGSTFSITVTNAALPDVTADYVLTSFARPILRESAVQGIGLAATGTTLAATGTSLAATGPDVVPTVLVGAGATLIGLVLLGARTSGRPRRRH